MTTCRQCGFVYDLDRCGAAGRNIVGGAMDLGLVLVDPSSDVARRRDRSVWSPLEYGCHVRDVLLVQRERILAARRTDGFICTPMGRDERVDHDGYAEQEAVDVARQLGDAASMLARVLERLDGPDWGRSVLYGYPQSAPRSLRWVAVHTAHEVHHHLLDVITQTRTPRRN